MNNGLVIISLFFLASCSATWKSEFLVPQPIAGALDVELYDWEIELYGGPAIGNVRPQIYGYEIEGAFYFIYPREISRSGFIGPPVIPIGLGVPKAENKKSTLFVLRLFDPSGFYKVTPLKLSILSGEELQASCDFERVSKDKVGILYGCLQSQVSLSEQPTKILVEFNNQHRVAFPIELETLSGYSPLFSFNGPNPKPSIKINGDRGVHVYPK